MFLFIDRFFDAHVQKQVSSSDELEILIEEYRCVLESVKGGLISTTLLSFGSILILAYSNMFGFVNNSRQVIYSNLQKFSYDMLLKYSEDEQKNADKIDEVNKRMSESTEWYSFKTIFSEFTPVITFLSILLLFVVGSMLYKVVVHLWALGYLRACYRYKRKLIREKSSL